MEVLDMIYWTRACFGILAAIICVVLRIGDLYLGISVGLIVYLLTGYVLRSFFITKVETPSKIFTTGIGMYFLTWILSWILFYSIFGSV